MINIENDKQITTKFFVMGILVSWLLELPNLRILAKTYDNIPIIKRYTNFFAEANLKVTSVHSSIFVKDTPPKNKKIKANSVHRLDLLNDFLLFLKEKIIDARNNVKDNISINIIVLWIYTTSEHLKLNITAIRLAPNSIICSDNSKKAKYSNGASIDEAIAR